eukprot:2624093-Prymnesium_polylepis.1
MSHIACVCDVRGGVDGGGVGVRSPPIPRRAETETASWRPQRLFRATLLCVTRSKAPTSCAN